FWLLGFAYYTLRLVQVGPSWSSALGAGGTLGLALATKGTAFVFAAPILAWHLQPLVGALKQRRLSSVMPFLVLPLLVLALNAGYASRNMAMFGSPLGHATEMSNDEYTPQTLLSNVMRNL